MTFSGCVPSLAVFGGAYERPGLLRCSVPCYYFASLRGFPPQLPVKTQELVIPYWTAERGAETTLLLRNNSGANDISIEILVRNSSGLESRTSLTLRPRQAREVPFPIFFPGASGDFGQVLLQFESVTPEAVLASATIRINGKPTSVAAVPKSTSTAEVESHLFYSVPDPDSTMVVVLSNPSTDPVAATFSAGRQVVVAPRTTVRIPLEAPETAGTQVIRAPATLLITPLASGAAAGSVVTSAAPGTPESKVILRGAPLRIVGSADRSYGLLVHNASGHPVAGIATLRQYSGDSSAGVLRIPFMLNPAATSLIPLNVSRQGAAQWVAADIEYSSSRDDVAALLVARSAAATATYPLFPGASAAWVGPGWSARAGTGVRIVNATAKVASYSIVFYDRQGSAAYETADAELQAGQDRVVDFAELARRAVPDAKGRALPTEGREGTFEVRTTDTTGSASLFVAATTPSSDSVSVEPSLIMLCCGHNNPYLNPDPWSEPAGFISPEQGYVYDSCQQGYKVVGADGWGIDNTSVATVRPDFQGWGQITGVTPGNTYTFAEIDTWLGGIRCGIVMPQQVQAGVSVVNVSLSCTSPVVRGQSTTCTASVSGAPYGTRVAYSGWSFTDGTNTVSSTSSADTWSGPMVTSGTVSVTVSVNGSPTSTSSSITVNPRTGFAFNAASVGSHDTNPYTCVGQAGSVTIDVNNTPQAGSIGGDYIGKYCDIEDSSYNGAMLGTGGPNAGYSYVTSPINQASFHWIIAADADNPSSTFYKAQCGNWNGSAGFISGAQLRANTINHESGTVKGHYGQYLTAQNDPANNVGTGYEPIVVFGDLTALQNAVSNSNDLIRRGNAIKQATANESTLFDVNHDANGVLDGPINFSPYAPCN